MYVHLKEIYCEIQIKLKKKKDLIALISLLTLRFTLPSFISSCKNTQLSQPKKVFSKIKHTKKLMTKKKFSQLPRKKDGKL